MSDPAPWRRQSSQPGDAAHSPDVGGGGSIPPPPPPPVPGGALPSLRINSEIDGRGRSPKPTAPGEPPAAIQNAMMTKDKKPFTYTPGGLDLSQIRSPRIQRRINRNMADEGVGPLPPQQEHGPLPPAAQAAMQPNIQVQVLPPMAPPPPPPPPQAGLGPQPSRFGGAAPVPPHQPAPFAPPLGGAQASVSAQAVQQTAANLRPTNIAPLRRVEQQPEPGSLYIAPITPSATPTAPATPRSQLGSLYIPPVDVPDAASPPPPPQRHYSPQSPQASLNKAPTPWMSSLHQQQPQQQQQQARQMASPTVQSAGPGTPGTRIIPIQIEGREPSTPHTPQSPQEAHLSQWQREQQLRQQQRQQQPQFQQPQYQQPQFQQPQYQQPQYQQPQYQQQQQQVPWRTAQQQPSSPPVQPVHQVQQGGERLIPMQVEGATSNGISRQQQQRRPPGPAQQQNSNSGAEWGAGPPIQSQSFRVLQKITDDPVAGSSVPRNQQPGRINEMNAAQLRKLQLNEEDQALMNRFKAQVDDEVYLHQESDPRYRGAAIPSRAFRMLQNMTGEDDGSAPIPSRISPAVRAAQQAVQEASQPYVPPSEQTVQEPRKYTGGAIPSRSFRMLQAMTGSENCDPADTSDL